MKPISLTWLLQNMYKCTIDIDLYTHNYMIKSFSFDLEKNAFLLEFIFKDMSIVGQISLSPRWIFKLPLCMIECSYHSTNQSKLVKSLRCGENICLHLLNQ